MRRTLALAGLVLTLPFAASAASRARATLRDVKGENVGTAALEETADGVHITVEVQKLPPGPHGFHVHEVGKCEGPEFKSAGAHFNPGAKKHGLDNPEGAHAGDMQNLVAGPDGSAKGEFVARGATLAKSGPTSLLKEGGTAIVLHANADDMKTDPAGNAGPRMACGVVTAAK
jgi:Cu-Zn family superoxide dismutase